MRDMPGAKSSTTSNTVSPTKSEASTPVSRPAPFQFLQAQEVLKLSEPFWQERPTGGSDRLSTSSAPSSGSTSCELSPNVSSPASDALLCPSASAVPTDTSSGYDSGDNSGYDIIPEDTSPSVRPENPIALAVPTSSHSGTHASSMQVWCWACVEPHDMSTCPEAADDQQRLEAALLMMPPSPTDEERIQARKEQAYQWRMACGECKSYVRTLVLDWTPPGLRVRSEAKP